MTAMSSLPAGVTGTLITTSRLRTHVLQAGPADAPALVLVHGNVSAARFFAEIMPLLAGRCRCLAPDLRGFGESEPAPVDARRGIRDFADDLHAVLTETGLVPSGQRVHLLGWSLGGGVAMQYAIDHPGAVASIVLESPMSPFGFGGTRDEAGAPCWPDFAGSGGGTANPELVRRIAAGDRSADDPASPRQVLTSLYVRPPASFPPALEDDLVDAMLAMATGDDHYPGDVVASPNWPGAAPGERGVNNAISPRFCDLSGFAAAADRPDVLWIRGDSDQIVSDASLVDLGNLGALGAVPGWPGPDVFPAQPMVGQLRAVLDRYRAAGGRYTEHVLAGCGHSPHLERPSEFADLVTGFLAGHGAGGR
ncbi:MAG: alpha/beta hydrolase [Actinobacteria bacterium]|nr:alpha/beta hydrolase [Actinomycetota bacterium]MBO0787745.1 alpha/beta hydrolase [Actinomycetota bacterium]MBO0814924.1 alpha/beta hydrolase [Actinomycetota bacterium]